jgi:predicted GNAT superfamily acetyltransferase
MFPLRLRALTTLDEFRRVFALEQEVWGYPNGDEAVPASVLAASVRRGAILVGAFDASDRLVGVVYSVPAVKAGRLTHWSHMLAVAAAYRSAGVGRALKLEQRERALGMGVDVIEWTFDPLQPANAHLNFAKLGVIVEEYEENVYGENPNSPLWAGLATDRFVAEWRIATAHVERRIKRGAGPVLRATDVLLAEPVNGLRLIGARHEPVEPRLHLSDPRLSVVVPLGFTEMQAADTGLARAWRASTREIFTTYFGRGYRAIDFWLDRRGVAGMYLLAHHPAGGD